MWTIALLALFLQGNVKPVAAQSTKAADLAPGKLLVASRDLQDPNFAKTVVILLQCDDDGIVGLIVNRRSKVAVSRVVNAVPGAKTRTDPVYAGGPVDTTDVLALARITPPTGDVQRVFSDVFLVSTKRSLEKTFASKIEPGMVRVYLGYAGWTKPQLENEVALGAWYIFQASVKAVFDTDPDSLWERLIRETEMRVASLRAENRVAQ